MNLPLPSSRQALRAFAAWILFALAAVLLAPAAQAAGPVVTTERVRAELLAHAPEGVAPGKPLWLGLQIRHQPEWHTYWKNPGDSGLPTELAWTLPAGLAAGEIAWPLPRKIPIGPLANYGYEGTVLLAVPVTVAPDFRAPPFGDVTIHLRANWLVCKKECIPEEGEFSLRLPVAAATVLHGPSFDAALAAQPQPLAAGMAGVRPESSARVDGNHLVVTMQQLPVAARGQTLEFFPETPGVIEPGAEWTQAWKGAAWTARVPLSPQRSESPNVLPIVVAAGAQGWRAEVPVAGGWPAAAAVATVSPALESALRDNARAPAAAAPTAGWIAALVGALLGGLILNLMPCVFPVLAIKVVGFTRHAEDRRGLRLGGLAYTAGVIVSFLALAGVLLALRAAGEQLGWGFQLQSPAVVAALAALFTLIGLNLAGVFEFGSVLPSRVAAAQAQHPVADAFLTGVLAVAVAAPCTAPFMGASLGFAATLPALQALAIFALLGLGLALPYLVASWVPAVAGLLPRPGPWMDTFRRLMAFPMFGTVAWLTWVLGQQSGVDGAGALLALLVALSLLAWTLTLRGRSRAALGGLALASLALLAWGLGPALVRPAPAAAVAQQEGPWQPWSPERVDTLLAQGQPVFVDFTAAWCVTCQYNKKTTLARGDVLADFTARNVALLRADWTRRDPAITAALAGLGRNGVPVYVLYRRGAAPVVLSEILGVDEVRAALARL